MSESVRIGTVGIAPVGIDGAAARILAEVGSGTGRDVHLVNAFTVANADSDPGYAGSLSGAWLNLADGLPLQWLSRLRGDQPVIRQVRGADLMRKVLAESREAKVGHYLLGANGRTVELLRGRIERDWPGAVIAGSSIWSYRRMTEEEKAAEIEALRGSGAGIIWIGTGAPSQDRAASQFASELPAVCIAVGAAFDYLAGTRPEAPRLMRRLGLEWLFRLASEPARLWRRYASGNLRFMRIALTDLAGRFRDNPRDGNPN